MKNRKIINFNQAENNFGYLSIGCGDSPSNVYFSHIRFDEDGKSILFSKKHAATRARRMAFAALYFVLLQQAKP